MPIFEFICKKCQSQFELLLYSREVPLCPNCQSAELSRLVSRVSFIGTSAATPSVPASSGKCSHCSSGNCSHC